MCLAGGPPRAGRETEPRVLPLTDTDAEDTARDAANIEVGARSRLSSALSHDVGSSSEIFRFSSDSDEGKKTLSPHRCARGWPAAMSATATQAGKSLVRVTQYNLLAQCYVRSAIFTHSPGPALKYVLRRRVRPSRVPTRSTPPTLPPPRQSNRPTNTGHSPLFRRLRIR